MPDLRSDQCAKQKASEYGARRGPGLFTELFTARCTVVTIGSAPGYGHFGSLSSSTGQEDGGGGYRGVLERRKFSPGIPEVISKPLKDSDSLQYRGHRAILRAFRLAAEHRGARCILRLELTRRTRDHRKKEKRRVRVD